MPEVHLFSLAGGARAAVGAVAVIDVFRAFTAAAVTFDRGAEAIVMVDDVDQALDLRRRGMGDICIGERRGLMPPGFDFANSPGQLAAADLDGLTVIQTTSNGTAGLHLAADRAERLYAAALVTTSATARALAGAETASLVAMGRRRLERADEDEICALFIRARLEGRSPDAAAMRRFTETLVPPPSPKVVAAGDYHPDDRRIALDVDRFAFAIRVRREAELLIARPEPISR